MKDIATNDAEDKRLNKMTTLQKFRADAAAREKKHDVISKNSGGMTSAIDRLEKHMNKEEVEQIDEISKKTVKSWLSKQEVVPPKKPDMDRKAHNQRIKTRSKSWDSALDRLTGRKPTSENSLDPQAATQACIGPGEGPSEIQVQRSKSARMIKALYKNKGMKEETYDWEKDDKAPQKLNKGVKIETPKEEASFGANKPQARIVMSGGKTLTGEKRDTVEIDPLMAKRNDTPNQFDKPVDKKDK
jgi:hypothetical protein